MTRETASNLIDGEVRPAESGEWLEKARPADGTALCRLARSGAADVDAAVQVARVAQEGWAERTAVERGDLVREIALALRERRDELAEVVVEETGKQEALALGEVDAAVELGMFVAGEGRRYYGRTTTASMPHRTVMTVRQPVGVAGLLISFNTPLPNVAWKVFPAIFCGNGAVLKPSEETPLSANLFATTCHEVGLPAGVLNVVQGLGVGGRRRPRGASGRRSRQLHGLCGDWTLDCRDGRPAAGEDVPGAGRKNALVVCGDADLDNAVRWAVQSSFSNAGQRCAAASRIVVFDAVYDEFRRGFLEAAEAFTDTGPVISEASLERIVETLARAGGTVLCGGERLDRDGWWLPADRSRGHRAGRRDLVHRALRPGDDPLSRGRSRRGARRRQRLSVRPDGGGPHGEPPSRDAVCGAGRDGGGGRERRHARLRAAHGLRGVKQSGTGWREPGVEALDVYSEWKYVNLISDPSLA